MSKNVELIDITMKQKKPTWIKINQIITTYFYWVINKIANIIKSHQLVIRFSDISSQHLNMQGSVRVPTAGQNYTHIKFF